MATKIISKISKLLKFFGALPIVLAPLLEGIAMLSTLINFVISIFNFFSSLPPETKERIYNLFLDMFEALFRQMYKNKTGEKKNA